MAQPALPGSFTPISLISSSMIISKVVINIIGYVIDFRDPIQSRGGDMTMTLKVCDKSRPDPAAPFSIRLFRREKEELPPLTGHNNVIALYGISVTEFGGVLLGMANKIQQLAWIVSSRRPNDGRVRISSYPVTKLVLPGIASYMAHLQYWWDRQKRELPTTHVSAGSAQGAVQRGRRLTALIKDMKVGNFYDVTGQIVKVFDCGRPPKFVVYITDYTENKSLYDYQWNKRTRHDPNAEYHEYGSATDNFSWKGPYGQYTLQVALWESHATAAKAELHDGLYVTLRNVHAKQNPDGQLEGEMHGDRMYPHKINFRIIDKKDPRVRELLQRQQVYKCKNDKKAVEHQQRMQPAMERRQLQTGEKEKELQEQEEYQYRQVEQLPTKRTEELNKYVQCAREQQPAVSIGEVLNSQDTSRRSVPRIYKITARVVDFLPLRLEGFACRVESEDREEPTDTETSDYNDVRITSSQKYEKHEDGTRNDGAEWVWRFALLLQDESGQTLRAIVEGKDGEHLLQEKAFDLAHNPKRLGIIREKLFILWGDLEERKNANLEAGAAIDPLQAASKRKRKRGGRIGNGYKKQKVQAQPAEPGKSFDTGSDDEQEADEQEKPKMFHACVKEYFIERNGEIKKMHRLCNTTIHENILDTHDSDN